MRIFLYIIFFLIFFCCSCNRGKNNDDSIGEFDNYELKCKAIDTIDNRYIEYSCNGIILKNPIKRLTGKFTYDILKDTIFPSGEITYKEKERIVEIAEWHFFIEEYFFERGRNPHLNSVIFYDQNGDTIKERSKYCIVNTKIVGDSIDLNLIYNVDEIIDSTSRFYFTASKNGHDIFNVPSKSNNFHTKLSIISFGRDSSMRFLLYHNKNSPNDSTKYSSNTYAFELQF